MFTFRQNIRAKVNKGYGSNTGGENDFMRKLETA